MGGIMGDLSTPIPQPAEQLPITLFDSVILAARTTDGTIWLVLRDLCATLGLALEAQRRRIRANDLLHLSQLRLREGHQLRTLDVLQLDDVPIWLIGLQTQRVSEGIRERVEYVRAYLVGAVRAAFAQLTGLPESSRQVEDLRDLDRLELALRSLEELGTRQSTLEASQDRARTAFRDLTSLVREIQSRVQALEAQSKQRLSSAQRGTLYQLVQTWGHAQAARKPDRRSGESIRTCWRLFNQRFGISTYTDLPATRYDEVLQFIKQQYRALTGSEIDAIEQSGVELE
jgi:P22_AR N-terminal domain/ORF6C domain